MIKCNTPTILQYEATECGAASLGMILGYYGKHCRLTELRKACGINRDGSSAIKILKAAQQYGCITGGKKYSIEQLFKQKPPFIIFWKFYHFLVVEGWNENKTEIYLNDPAEGKYSVNETEFDESYTGITLLVRPGEDFKKSGKITNIWERLLNTSFTFPTAIVTLLFIAILNIVPQLVIAGSAAQFANGFLSEGHAYFGLPIFWISLISVTVLGIFSSLSKLILRRLGYRLSKRISANLFIKLFSSQLNFFAQRSSGEVATRLLLGIALSSSIIGQILSFVLTLISSLLLLIFTAFINAWLTLMTLIVIVFNLGLSYYFTETRKDENKKLSRQQGLVSGTGLVAIKDIQMIKSCGLEVETLNNWMNVYTSFNYQQQVLGSQVGIMTTMAITSRFVLNVAVLIVGGLQIIDGRFTLGGLLAFQFLQPTLQAPIGGIASLGSVLQLVDGYFGRTEDLTEEEDEPNVTSLKTTKNDFNIIDLNNERGINVEIKDLCFAYGANEDNFIDSLNITVKEGTSLTICGPSGCGKSTLLKLIAGLYTQNSGKIKFDGVTREEYGFRQFSSAVAYVPQDIFMFDTSFANNISLWDPDIKQEDIEWACNMADIADFIRTFPQSYSYNIGQGGSKLSGGQKQRISIARSLARRPELVLLDEATSALDNKSETKVINSILANKMTVISVSHRLYTAVNSDNVLVMQNGKLMEYGPPYELLKRNGLFSELVKSEEASK
ncbi:ABC transporter family protein/ peptidase C39 domain-containing protein [Synechococcus sp. MEDNS5]|uniref:cysteine peptidase family C39 domain-containing protein n=1 Tax=Synechococcus sp. MEDNS5 TaxID=1442554 RepID=UPI00164875DF|nr:cysteine peptidase family C39 domain-containing protein [Synechococcus sp. MEDNS5]QNJ06869.1 ABC transporter family protein/ peptidase C39 domain-containing protein [Synechococcus sp. MEDNS5]